MRSTAALLTATVVLAISDGAMLAQNKPEPPDGTICQPPQCDIRRSLPIPLEGPLEAVPALVAFVKATSVDLLSPQLPGMTLDEWLVGTLLPYTDLQRPWPAGWTLTFCDEHRSAIPRAGPDLCVEASVPISYSRTVMLLIAVAEGRVGGDGLVGWIQHTPSIRDIYIEYREEGAVETLDVATLSALPPLLQIPPATPPPAQR